MTEVRSHSYQDEFPVSKELTYLNHAAVSPLCRRAAQAMHRLTEDAARFGSLHYSEWTECYSGLRRAAAQLIGAKPEEIAIVKNTSEGISTVAFGMNWGRGDRVIAFREEFPANLHPWARLSERGVEVEWLSIYDPLDRIAESLPGAKLLAISFVNYLSGYRVNLRSLGELCRQNNCFFFVDAIQGLGAFPLDVEECRIDALAADGHKWLLGPEGNGVLYVRQSRFETLTPIEFGWTNLDGYNQYPAPGAPLRPDAGRYECGTLNTVGCFGLRASIEFLLEVGLEQVRASVEFSASRLGAGVTALGYELMCERTPETGSGIITFRHPQLDSEEIVTRLAERKVIAAARHGWIRMSPHFYATATQIDRTLELLSEMR